jgi:hypothetical protein
VNEICFDEGSLPTDLTGVATAYNARTPEPDCGTDISGSAI